MRGNITVVYGYEPIFNDAIDDPLRRFDRVKIESTSFTVSEPIQQLEIAPLIYELTTDQKSTLHTQFNVAPFPILTIKLERIFIDKVFATEFYFRKLQDSPLDQIKRNEFAFDVAKHMYDLMILHDQEKILALLSDQKELSQLIQFKRQEETVRSSGIDASLKIQSFSYLRQALENKSLSSAYNRMQDIYVFLEKDRKPYSEVTKVPRMKN